MSWESPLKHKRQHYIPATYLRAWHDPNTPANQTPYIWIYPTDSLEAINKAPMNFFTENDFYTFFDPEGNRDLNLEQNLGRVENEFAKIRRTRLNHTRSLSDTEYLMICMFIASTYGRTKLFAAEWSDRATQVLQMGEKIVDRLSQATSDEDRKRLLNALPYRSKGEGQVLTFEDMKRLQKNPTTELLPELVPTLSKLLMQFPYIILIAPPDIEYVTTDAPVVWFDPKSFMIPRPFGAGGLVSPTLEITLPISPQQLIFISSQLFVSGHYTAVDKSFVEQLNYRTMAFSHRFIIASHPIDGEQWFKKFMAIYKT